MALHIAPPLFEPGFDLLALQEYHGAESLEELVLEHRRSVLVDGNSNQAQRQDGGEQEGAQEPAL